MGCNPELRVLGRLKVLIMSDAVTYLLPIGPNYGPSLGLLVFYGEFERYMSAPVEGAYWGSNLRLGHGI